MRLTWTHLSVAVAFLLCGGSNGQTPTGHAPLGKEVRAQSPLEKDVLTVLEGRTSDPAVAARLIKSVIAKASPTDPFLSKAYYMAANQEFDAQNYLGAAEDCTRSLSIPVGAEFIHIAAANMRIQCYSKLGENEKVVDASAALIALPESKDTQPIVNLARRLKYEALASIAVKSRSAKDVELAEVAFEDMIARQRGKTDQMSVEEHRAAVGAEFTFFRNIGDRKKAVAIIKDYLKRNPKDPYAAPLALDMVLAEKNTSLEEVRPNHIAWIADEYPCMTNAGIRVLYQIAFAEFRWGDPAKALKYIEKVSSYEPGEDVIGYMPDIIPLGAKLAVMCYEEMGQHGKAIQAAQDVIRRYPGTPMAEECRLQLEVWGSKAQPKPDSGKRQSAQFAILGALAVSAGFGAWKWRKR